jgi:hypothetical protein
MHAECSGSDPLLGEIQNGDYYSVSIPRNIALVPLENSSREVTPVQGVM